MPDCGVYVANNTDKLVRNRFVRNQSKLIIKNELSEQMDETSI